MSPDRRVQGRKAEAQGQMPYGLPDGASEAETAASGTGDTSGKRREEAFAGDSNIIMVIKLYAVVRPHRSEHLCVLFSVNHTAVRKLRKPESAL